MYSPGFFPKGYLCKPFNGGYDIVQGLAARYGFDPFDTPWDADDRGRAAGLPLRRSRTAAGHLPQPHPAAVHHEEVNFPGFYGWIRDWDVGGTYTDATSPAPTAAAGDCAPTTWP